MSDSKSELRVPKVQDGKNLRRCGPGKSFVSSSDSSWGWVWGKFKSVLEIGLFCVRFKHHIPPGLWQGSGGGGSEVSALKLFIRTDGITQQGCGYIWAYSGPCSGPKHECCDWLMWPSRWWSVRRTSWYHETLAAMCLWTSTACEPS